MKNIIDDLKNKKECSFLASKNKVERHVNEDFTMICTSKKDKSIDRFLIR